MNEVNCTAAISLPKGVMRFAYYTLLTVVAPGYPPIFSIPQMTES